MTLGHMRRQGVRSLIAYCLNHACRHQAIIEVWSYPPETEIAYLVLILLAVIVWLLARAGV